MRNSFFTSIVAVASLFVFSSVAFGQFSPDKKPSNEPFDPHDLSGLWAGLDANRPYTKSPSDVPLNAAGQAEWMKNVKAGVDLIDPLFKCEPAGVPRNYFNGHPIEFEMGSSGKILELFEAYRNFRIFYMDGRKQPSHPEGTWYGDSVGHWEGNTLVVDTVNLNGRNWVDILGHPSSDQLHLTERFTRTDHDHLQDEITIEDPTYYTKAWGGTKHWVLRNDEIVEDYMCSPHDVGVLDQDVTDPANGIKP